VAQKSIASFGTWKSPLGAALITQAQITRTSLLSDGKESLNWLELRPLEGGRVVPVKWNPVTSSIEDLLVALPTFNVRSRVHEYGGGAWGMIDATTFWATNFKDQRVYTFTQGQAEPTPVTKENDGCVVRYADAEPDNPRRRLIAVCEDHADPKAPRNYLASISLDGSSVVTPLLDASSGEDDFVAFPRLSPDGTRLAWIGWKHPNLPWDDTTLYIAGIDAATGRVNSASVETVAQVGVSLQQPTWAPNGDLYYVTDVSGWWNIVKHTSSGPRPVYPAEAEFGRPLWQMGVQQFVFSTEGKVIYAIQVGGVQGKDVLLRLNLEDGTSTVIPTPFSTMSCPTLLKGGAELAVIVAFQDRPGGVAVFDLTSGSHRLLFEKTPPIDPSYVSKPTMMAIPVVPGKIDAGMTYAWVYHPTNPEYIAPEGEKPPLIVLSHGGPTGAANSDFSLSTQYWTTRGFAVADVNYRGSTGFGSAYRHLLKKNWGVYDVDDCCAVALFLAEQGLADRNRLAITGASAGGYTTLAALAFRKVFSAGCSKYGIGDLTMLAADTHKFESRYLDTLIAPYPAGEALYHERSPLQHCDQMTCPVIFFQGLEDKVVPPNQAQAMVAALKAKGICVAHIEFEAEQHGFRRAENIVRSVEGQLDFFSRIFGFSAADTIDPVTIMNFNDNKK